MLGMRLPATAAVASLPTTRAATVVAAAPRARAAPRTHRRRGTAAAAASDAAAATPAAAAVTSPSPGPAAPADGGGDYWAAALWGDGAGATTAAMSAGELKAALLDSFYGAERGLSAGLEARAEVAELIAQLEAASPPPADLAESLALLDGEWRLAYTSGSELLAVLALGRLPLVSVGDVTQTIDAARGTFENVAEVSVLGGAAGTTRLSARASFEALSARRIAIRFETGGIAAPRLSGALPFDLGALPASLPLPGGGSLDLSGLRPALAPLEEGARAALALAGSLLDRAPDLELPIPGGNGGGGGGGGGFGGGSGGSAGSGSGARTWLVTTYLDADLRVSRGDGGGVFVLQRVAPAEQEEAGEWGRRAGDRGSVAEAAAVRGSGAADFDGLGAAGSVSFTPPPAPLDAPEAAAAAVADALDAVRKGVEAAAEVAAEATEAAAEAAAEVVLEASAVYEPPSSPPPSSSSSDPTSSSR